LSLNDLAVMRVATWNVERVNPKGWKIAPAQRQRMAEVEADIWILTETHVDHGPGDEYRGIHARRPSPNADPRENDGSGSGAGTR
jgi:hypothetical protein